ncbi:MAG: DUF1761 domain-containing protein [Bacteroidales bacterium]
MESAFENLNWLAILVASVSAFAIGSLWYSALMFQKPWMKANNFTDESIAGANMLKIFGLSFLLMFIAAFSLAMYLGPGAGGSFGATAGFMAGAFWVMAFMGVVYLFERRPLPFGW